MLNDREELLLLEENRQLRRVALRLYQYGNSLAGWLESDEIVGANTPSIAAGVELWSRVRGEYERLTSTKPNNNSHEGKA